MGRECGSSGLRDLIRVAGLHRSSSSALPEADLDALFAYLGHMARQKDIVLGSAVTLWANRRRSTAASRGCARNQTANLLTAASSHAIPAPGLSGICIAPSRTGNGSWRNGLPQSRHSSQSALSLTRRRWAENSG